MVEGPRAVDAALDRGAPLEAVYFGPRADVAFPALRARIAAAGVRVAVLKEGVLEKVGTTRTPQPVLAVARMPDTAHRRGSAGDGLVVVGVELRDPGNLGTLLRSAEASGAAAIVLGPRIGRRVQSQGRSGVGRCDLRGPGGGRGVGRVVRGGGARRARRARPAAAGCRRRHRGTPYADVDFTASDRGGARQRGPRPGRRRRRPPRRPRDHPDGRRPPSRSTSRWPAPCCASSRRGSARQPES